MNQYYFETLPSSSSFIKFCLSEKHTKFEKIFLMVLTNQLIYLVNVKITRKIFSNYVCFSKSPNFKKKFVPRVIFFERFGPEFLMTETAIFLSGYFLVLSIKDGPVKCGKVCDKSVVILNFMLAGLLHRNVSYIPRF